MDLREFKKEFIDDVQVTAEAENTGSSEAFVQKTCELLYFYDELSEEHIHCYYEATVGRKKFKVDAYTSYDYDNVYTYTLIISDYSGSIEESRLTKSEAEVLYSRLSTFIEECMTGRLKKEIDFSAPIYSLVDEIFSKQKEIRKFALYIVTDKLMSDRITELETKTINDIPCEYHIWDINRLYRLIDRGENENDEIVLSEFQVAGIPCLKATSVEIEHCVCYLCVLSGTLLADIFDKYGSKLLEGNVRTFLSVRGKVNKAIRATILSGQKNMFFAYNNGIAATASEICIENINGMPHIVSLKNLQIVNGGQTTASLSNTRYKDKASLDGIYVQMKLTVVDDPELSGEIIPNISKYSNSQNIVKDADFFSNHDFNRRMQKISRQLDAPAAPGFQYGTRWFYERARGQYENEQKKMTASEKRQFQIKNPKNQMFDKTMFAKLENSWLCLPHKVCMGAQINFNFWAERIENDWKLDSDIFNELYFKNVIALLIIYSFLSKQIPKEKWFRKAYKSSIIMYTMSFLSHKINNQFKGKTINRSVIWQNQKLDDVLESVLIEIAEIVHDFIMNAQRPVDSLLTWTKRTECWERCKSLPYELPKIFESILVTEEVINSAIAEGRKTHQSQSGIETQFEVKNYGVSFWKKVIDFVVEKRCLTPTEWSILKTVKNIERGFLPSEKQSAVILKILKKIRDEGFVE